MFYPQLVAGPIERPQNLIHQFREQHYFDYERVTDGLKLMLWGLFKKIVVADRLAIYVNAVYEHPSNHNSSSLVLATVFFAFQIYCDFSGYSDIAIGAARVMGFRLMSNFRQPYLATNISDFWKRWHISLSSWFKDYVYLPLGGNRVAIPRWCINIMLVFLISGLWHGANWTFVIWGGLNGLFLILHHSTEKPRASLASLTGLNRFPVLQKALGITTTFILVSISWIFFRAGSMEDAMTIIHRIIHERGPLFVDTPSMMIYAFIGIIILIMVDLQTEDKGRLAFMNSSSGVVRQISYSVLILLILLIGVFDGGEFIYFQF
jgi:D-alanyl-lipoteichoic acid acyltransferase DltB (MBOAT superfamily)